MKALALAIVLLALPSLARAQSQTPYVLDAVAHCETTVTDTAVANVTAAGIYAVFCAASAIDGYSIWIDGEPITLTGELKKSDNMSSTGQAEYATPLITKVLTAGKHVISVIVGKFNAVTGKTEDASAPSMPLGLMALAAAPPSDCTDQVRLAIGEAKPRVVVPNGEVEVTFSLRLSKTPVTSLEIRLNGVAVPSGMIGPAPDLRGLGSFRFQAPPTPGDYDVTMKAFGANGCSDTIERHVPITVK